MRISDDSTGNPEAGFTLAALIVILTIMSIIIAFTVPEQWSMVMRRERDRQTIFMMKQYARSILNWQQKHGALPTGLEQLEKARQPRFVRYDKRPPMPITGSDEDWIMVPPGAVEQQPGMNPGGPTTTNPPTTTTGGGSNITSPWNRVNPPQPSGTPGGTGTGTTKLNPEASPKDYVGPFVGVRPNAKGKSFVAFNGSEDYSEWVYTVQDLQNEIAARQAALTAK
jgi:type II secretory pathway pseudopilin PulG